MNTLFILQGYVVIYIINVLGNRTAIINIRFTSYKWCTRLYTFRRSATLYFGCSFALAALAHRFECVLALSISLQSSGCAVSMHCHAYAKTETVPA